MSNIHGNLLDASEELLIYRYGGGIKLVRPKDQHKQNKSPDSYYTGHTVGSCLDLNCCVYFGTTESRIQKINEVDAATINCSSPNTAIGKDPYSFLDHGSADRVVQHDAKTISTNRVLVSEETYTWKDNFQQEIIIVKSPLYDYENKTIGIFACGSVLGEQSIANFLNEVIQIGLLSSAKAFSKDNGVLSGSQIDGIYLSKRETEVLKQAALGKSARVVGAILGISQRTVESHLENIKMKLNVYSKSELIDKAIHAFYSK